MQKSLLSGMRIWAPCCLVFFMGGCATAAAAKHDSSAIVLRAAPDDVRDGCFKLHQATARRNK